MQNKHYRTGMGTTGNRGRGRVAGSGKTTHSRSYPRGVGLDFRKLSGLTLMGYIDHHGVPVRPEAPPSELAVAVARHFEAMEVEEEEVVGGFLSRLSAGRELGPLVPPPTTTLPGKESIHPIQARYASAAADYTRYTSHFDGSAPGPLVRRRRRSKNAARPGDQVAAKITRTDENGSWILASVQRFYADTETYDVQDEDDTSKLIRLPWNYVMRLSTRGTEGCFTKNSKVMAIFPETTSFYRAVVSREPVWVLPNGTNQPIVKEIILKFEDDEDAGVTPHRRVPARYVIPLPENYFYEDDDDVDLNPPNFSAA